MADLSDILTTLKNGVIGVNNLSQTLSGIDGHFNGTAVSAALTAPTLVYAGTGVVSSISITVAGTVTGTVNNAATTGAAAASNALCAIPNTVAVFHVNMPFTSGLVISPGTGQSVVVSYTTG
jgi:hypothetical protein